VLFRGEIGEDLTGLWLFINEHGFEDQPEGQSCTVADDLTEYGGSVRWRIADTDAYCSYVGLLNTMDSQCRAAAHHKLDDF